MKKLLVFTFIFLFINSLQAQIFSNLRTTQLVFSSDTLQIDSLSIVNGSFCLETKNGISLPLFDYEINYAQATLIIKNKTWLDSSLTATYRVFPYNFSSPVFHKEQKITVPTIGDPAFHRPYSNENTTNDLFDNETLQRNGSISRGITFGNNQNLVLNSSFNLQLAGKLNETFSVVAAITDENIPIQADGNSQQLQDFDNVHIKVFSEKISFTAGDLELKENAGNFFRLTKKVQGVGLQTFIGSEDKNIQLNMAAAVAKGKYNRLEIKGIEGNQGAYKLTGANAELYIAVLAGSEIVYLNGKRLTRGQENDYTIDYNAAELTFTTKQIITKDSRIVVEFEYSDQNYVRFLATTSLVVKNNDNTLAIRYFTEYDNKNQPLNQTLSTDNKILLATVGDSLHNALIMNVSQADTVKSDMVLYIEKDTIVNEIMYEKIYQYAANHQLPALLKVGFSRVGENKGNYRQVVSTANGRVFEWVAPINGIPQGSYEPVRLLIAPKKNELLVIAFQTLIAKKTMLETEIALSNEDRNLFSDLHNNNNKGVAFYLKTSRLFGSDSTDWKANTGLWCEISNKNFRTTERWRSTEFERDWNLQNTERIADEYFGGFFLDAFFNEKTNIHLKSTASYRGTAQKAIRNSFEGETIFGKQNIVWNTSLLNSIDNSISTNYIRSQTAIMRKNEIMGFGVRNEFENNTWQNSKTDSLISNSFQFNVWEFFIASNDSLKLKMKTLYNYRTDFSPQNNALQKTTYSHNFSSFWETEILKNQKISLNISYRKLVYSDTITSTAPPENNLSGSIMFTNLLFNSAVSISTFAEVSSGMEVKREFSYVEVAAGEGAYTWNDYNINNIAEIDEFEIAAFPDEGKYLRIWIPTDNYAKVYKNQFQEMITVNPAIFFENNEKIKKIAQRFNNRFAFSIDSKSIDYQRGIVLNSSVIPSEQLAGVNSSLKNIFTINKIGKFGFEYLFLKNNSGILLANGLEYRSSVTNTWKINFNMTELTNLSTSYSTGKKEFTSKMVLSKNHLVQYHEIGSQLDYEAGLNMTMLMKYSFTKKENTIGGEMADIHLLNCEIRYNAPEKGNFLASGSFINISYNGLENSSIAYVMLESLKVGKNYVWEIVFQRTIFKNMQMMLSYQGRKSENADFVHTGGMSIRAVF